MDRTDYIYERDYYLNEIRWCRAAQRIQGKDNSAAIKKYRVSLRHLRKARDWPIVVKEWKSCQRSSKPMNVKSSPVGAKKKRLKRKRLLSRLKSLHQHIGA